MANILSFLNFLQQLDDKDDKSVQRDFFISNKKDPIEREYKEVVIMNLDKFNREAEEELFNERKDIFDENEERLLYSKNSYETNDQFISRIATSDRNGVKFVPKLIDIDDYIKESIDRIKDSVEKEKYELLKKKKKQMIKRYLNEVISKFESYTSFLEQEQNNVQGDEDLKKLIHIDDIFNNLINDMKKIADGEYNQERYFQFFHAYNFVFGDIFKTYLAAVYDLYTTMCIVFDCTPFFKISNTENYEFYAGCLYFMNNLGTGDLVFGKDRIVGKIKEIIDESHRLKAIFCSGLKKGLCYFVPRQIEKLGINLEIDGNIFEKKIYDNDSVLSINKKQLDHIYIIIFHETKPSDLNTYSNLIFNKYSKGVILLIPFVYTLDNFVGDFVIRGITDVGRPQDMTPKEFFQKSFKKFKEQRIDSKKKEIRYLNLNGLKRVMDEFEYIKVQLNSDKFLFDLNKTKFLFIIDDNLIKDYYELYDFMFFICEKFDINLIHVDEMKNEFLDKFDIENIEFISLYQPGENNALKGYESNEKIKRVIEKFNDNSNMLRILDKTQEENASMDPFSYRLLDFMKNKKLVEYRTMIKFTKTEKLINPQSEDMTGKRLEIKTVDIVLPEKTEVKIKNVENMVRKQEMVTIKSKIIITVFIPQERENENLNNWFSKNASNAAIIYYKDLNEISSSKIGTDNILFFKNKKGDMFPLKKDPKKKVESFTLDNMIIPKSSNDFVIPGITPGSKLELTQIKDYDEFIKNTVLRRL